MEKFDIYRDIAERTGGDIYIGVVGPVRTGKSTLIAQMLETLVLPGMEEGYRRERVKDEVPQSGSGRAVMTTQPRFVPSEAVELELPGSGGMRVRMVDCVGYMVPGALDGSVEGEKRMVRTPWSAEEIPFEEAAEIGTRRVIREHSTLAVAVTTDGTITDIPRSSYVQAEERVIRELKETGKPFAIVLNSAEASGDGAKALADALREKYEAPVLLLDALKLSEGDISSLLEALLYAFPLTEVRVEVPEWVDALEDGHWLVEELLTEVRESGEGLEKVRDSRKFLEAMAGTELGKDASSKGLDLGNGTLEVELPVGRDIFYQVLGERCGEELRTDTELLEKMGGMLEARKEYGRLKDALAAVRETGYGMVPPLPEEMTLAEPQMVRKGNQFGVKLRASAPSLHLIRVDIEAEVSPVVGTEQQSEEMVKYLLSEFENDPGAIWASNMLGKSLSDLVREGIAGKLTALPEDVRGKLQETLQKIVNEGSGGMVCILL